MTSAKTELLQSRRFPSCGSVTELAWHTSAESYKFCQKITERKSVGYVHVNYVLNPRGYLDQFLLGMCR